MPTNSKPPLGHTQPRQALFAKVPLEWGPKWDHVREFSRGVAYRLYALCVGTGRQPPGLELDDVKGWWDICCRRLQMHPRDRGDAGLALKALREAGLIVFEDGHLRVLATKADYDTYHRPATVPQPSDVSPTTALRPSYVSPRSVTPENDSTHTSQIRLEKNRSEERETRARAREAPKFEIPPWVDDEWEDPTPPAETPPSVSPTPPEQPDHKAQNDHNMWAADPQPDNPMRIGHDFLVVLGLWNPGVRPDLVRWIGEQPEPERRAALEVLQRDKDWVRRSATVRHIVEHWRVYASGRTPIQRDARPGLASTVPVTIEDIPIAKLEESLRTQRFLAAKYPNESLGRDAVQTIARIEAQLAARRGRAA